MGGCIQKLRVFLPYRVHIHEPHSTRTEGFSLCVWKTENDKCGKPQNHPKSFLTLILPIILPDGGYECVYSRCCPGILQVFCRYSHDPSFFDLVSKIQKYVEPTCFKNSISINYQEE